MHKRKQGTVVKMDREGDRKDGKQKRGRVEEKGVNVRGFGETNFYLNSPYDNIPMMFGGSGPNYVSTTKRISAVDYAKKSKVLSEFVALF